MANNNRPTIPYRYPPFRSLVLKGHQHTHTKNGFPIFPMTSDAVRFGAEIEYKYIFLFGQLWPELVASGRRSAAAWYEKKSQSHISKAILFPYTRTNFGCLRRLVGYFAIFVAAGDGISFTCKVNSCTGNRNHVPFGMF